MVTPAASLPGRIETIEKVREVQTCLSPSMRALSRAWDSKTVRQDKNGRRRWKQSGHGVWLGAPYPSLPEIALGIINHAPLLPQL